MAEAVDADEGETVLFTDGVDLVFQGVGASAIDKSLFFLHRFQGRYELWD